MNFYLIKMMIKSMNVLCFLLIVALWQGIFKQIAMMGGHSLDRMKWEHFKYHSFQIKFDCQWEIHGSV